MKRLTSLSMLVAATCALGSLAHAQTPKTPDLSSLHWIAGARYVDRADGTKSYETFLGPVNGLISGAVVTPANGGMVEFFSIGPNEHGVFGMAVANSKEGLTNWRFSPLKSLEPGRIVFGDDERSFSIAATPDGGTHNISLRKVNGEAVKQEWHWKPVPAKK